MLKCQTTGKQYRDLLDSVSEKRAAAGYRQFFDGIEVVQEALKSQVRKRTGRD
jgi:hypothetical protein